MLSITQESDTTRNVPGASRHPGPETAPLPPVRRKGEPQEPLDLRRIVRLFAPYRSRVGMVAGLIFLSAILGLAQPFLIREIVDVALPDRDTGLLTWLVLGMVGAAIIGSALDVGQTLLSNTVGQRVMHDLRTKVYDHLQKMSLAFFTRTRSGEV
jgi:ATP-binding cassette subfamily B protein